MLYIFVLYFPRCIVLCCIVLCCIKSLGTWVVMHLNFCVCSQAEYLKGHNYERVSAKSQHFVVMVTSSSLKVLVKIIQLLFVYILWYIFCVVFLCCIVLCCIVSCCIKKLHSLRHLILPYFM